MAEYLVRFDRPVAYQPEHPRVIHKWVSALVCGAPTPEDAVQHAIRVTLGPGRVISVVDIHDAPEEAAAVKLLISARTPLLEAVVVAPA